MGSMRRVKLGDVALVEISGVDKKTNEGEASVRLCNFTDVYKNWAITSSMHDSFMVASANEREIAKFSLHRGQVAVTKDSETRDDIGIPTYIADNFNDVILGYHCALITPDETQLNGKYLNAFLHTEFIHKFFSANASGSGQRYTLSIETLNSIPIYLPPLEEQERIGNIFSRIDRKIELNRQINDYLADMARQLYNYWFVQFDFPNENGKPYKSSGGKMVWNEKLKRKIPEGWNCGSLLDIATYTNGIACQNYRPTDENKIPVIKIKEMHDGFTPETEFVHQNIPIAVRVFNGDVLFSWSASLEVVLWAGGNGGLNQHIFKVTSRNGYPRSFYYYQLLDYIAIFKQMAEARKTTMGHITRDHLEQSTIALPPSLDLPNRFDSLISPVFQQYIANQQDIDQSIKLRNELLPLFMNGQVYIRPLNNHLSHD